jgi:hypothetical protein
MNELFPNPSLSGGLSLFFQSLQLCRNFTLDTRINCFHHGVQNKLLDFRAWHLEENLHLNISKAVDFSYKAAYSRTISWKSSIQAHKLSHG